jgi:hypothetical protein
VSEHVRDRERTERLNFFRCTDFLNILSEIEKVRASVIASWKVGILISLCISSRTLPSSVACHTSFPPIDRDEVLSPLPWLRSALAYTSLPPTPPHTQNPRTRVHDRLRVLPTSLICSCLLVFLAVFFFSLLFFFVPLFVFVSGEQSTHDPFLVFSILIRPFQS